MQKRESLRLVFVQWLVLFLFVGLLVLVSCPGLLFGARGLFGALVLLPWACAGLFPRLVRLRALVRALGLRSLGFGLLLVLVLAGLGFSGSPLSLPRVRSRSGLALFGALGLAGWPFVRLGFPAGGWSLARCLLARCPLVGLGGACRSLFGRCSGCWVGAWALARFGAAAVCSRVGAWALARFFLRDNRLDKPRVYDNRRQW